MNDYPIDKYKFFVHGNTVIAETTYAKKRVKASAKCAPGDTFDLQKGKELAAARCNLKVAKKRVDRAYAKQLEAEDSYYRSRNCMYNAREYVDDSLFALGQAEKRIDDLESKY